MQGREKREYFKSSKSYLNKYHTYPLWDTEKKIIEKNEFAVIINDTIRLLTVYFVAHLLETMIHKERTFFDSDFLKTTLYFTIGTIFYHLVVKKMLFVDE